jgi:thioesterase domain-containing protein
MISADELEQRIRDGIPIAAQMAFQIRELTGDKISVVGGGEENINVHGTAFAGSIYAIATLALWGLVNANLPEGASLVLAEGSIRYRQPIVGEIEANCSILPDEMSAFLQNLEKRGRSRLEARVIVAGPSGAAAEYRGIVFARVQLPDRNQSQV